MNSDTISGPFVQLATICEMVLEDKSGSFSIIRMVDRLTVSGRTPEMQPSPVKATIAIAIKAGFMRQKAYLRIQPISPSGIELSRLDVSVLFEGEDRGVQMAVPMQVILKEEGLYWFNVSVDEQLLTRIPLRLLYQQIATVAQAAPEKSD